MSIAFGAFDDGVRKGKGKEIYSTSGR